MPDVISRREIVVQATGAAAAIAILTDRAPAQVASLGKFEVVKSDEEWRRELSPEQYAVLRRRDTERPWTSPLNKEHRPGTYLCAGCGLPLFSSSTKFESGTGWPSFWAPIEGAIETSEDRSFFFWFAPRFTVLAVEAISGTSSTMDRNRPAFAIA